MKLDCVCIRSSRKVRELGLDIFFFGDLYYIRDDKWTTLGTVREERIQLETFMIIPKEVYEVVGERLKLIKIFELEELDIEDNGEVFLRATKGFKSLAQYKLIRKPLYLTLTRP